ncbi:ubiquitin carboxyl-terminal hydrolase CYLD-like [Nilaparvata lugens]|uniref:ubiquitin carboxyl-terminal hydrolase CYLD-like n=1 Tax=Nilaparvata lugens TaxID=108931 RepID=UPI00193CBB67|nr:ubiquitin carboxyl-terminal hydrolase CYLD-like [Nilaparvata lugens]
MNSNRRKGKYLNDFYIVSKNVPATKKVEDGKKQQKTLILGSLVYVHGFVDDTHVECKVVSCEEESSGFNEDDVWICPITLLCRVNKDLWPLLQAIPKPTTKVCILKDKELCDELTKITIGSRVFFSDSENFVNSCEAVVKYKGPITRKGLGTFYGIEILDSDYFDYSEKNDGSYAGHKYFTCPPGRGKFVSVNKLRLTSFKMPTNSVMQLTDKFENLSLNNNQIDIPKNDGRGFDGSNMRPSDPPLKAGDRVVWVTDDANIEGVVKSFECNDFSVPIVEVELDSNKDYSNPISDRANRRKRIPALELVKADDFYDNSGLRRTKQRTKSEGSSSGYYSQNCTCRDMPCNKFRCSDSFQHNNFNSEKASTSKAVNDVCLNGLTGKDLCKIIRCDYREINKFPVPSNIKSQKIINSSGKLSPFDYPTNHVEDGRLSSSDCNYYDNPERGVSETESDSELCEDSLVEVEIDDEPHYGVIRWLGEFTDHKSGRPYKVAGIEMENEDPNFGNGTYDGTRYFTCNPNRSHFSLLEHCKKDSRFQDCRPNIEEIKKKEFGMIDCPVVPGIRQPITVDKDVASICGKNKGIQGHHNSCYLDATLFSMFTFTSVFDSLLFRPATNNDIRRYEEVQKVLREEIVNPLREKLFVRADRVMKLRTLLEELSSVSGLTSEEKDPEEFLTSLVTQILRAEPFLQFNTGQEANHYQLFVEKDEKLTFPTVQQLFEQSFLSSDIKLKQVPPCLIIQMPRFGKSFKMYPRILPSLLLDVTDIIENSPRQCTVCGELARFECKQCYNQCDEGLQSISFCERCLDKAHSHHDRTNHRWRPLAVPPEFDNLSPDLLGTIPRLYMELFAVVCIETSHYVAFVKCGPGPEAPWCFFDSMADRKGEQNGYNIPEMVACPNLPYWLSEKGAHHSVKDDRQLPEHEKRLLCDAYMCMYQSSEVMMYR